MAYDLMRFRDRIYVLDSSEIKKLILREFHVNTFKSPKILEENGKC